MFTRKDKVTNEKSFRLWFMMLTEIITTFLLVFWIVAPLAGVTQLADMYTNFTGDLFVLQAFWIAAPILVLTILFGWVSADMNPIVTIGRLATGKRNGTQAFYIIAAQFAAAFGAVYLVSTMGTGADLGSLVPGLQWSVNDANWFGSLPTEPTWGPALAGSTIGFLGLIVLIEAALSFLYVWAAVGTRKTKKKNRPFLTFIVLMLILTIGVHTGNVGLNPARTLASPIVAIATGNAVDAEAIMVVSAFMLIGQAIAALVYMKSLGKSPVAAKKVVSAEGNEFEIFKAEVRQGVVAIQADVAATKARYKWVLEGNEPIEAMDKEALQALAKKTKADKSIKAVADIEDLRRELALFMALGAKGYSNVKAEEEVALKRIEDLKAEEAKKAAAGKKAKKSKKDKKAKKAAPKKK